MRPLALLLQPSPAGCATPAATRGAGRLAPEAHLAPARAFLTGRRLAFGSSASSTGSSSSSRRPGHTRRGPVLHVTARHVAHPPLEDLQMFPVVNLQGYIMPDVPAGTEATVFAIYEQGKSLQYIGFSKDLRNSLRTLFGRRPDKTHFFRALHLPQLDQNEMVAIRSDWYEQSGGPPPGNKLAMERDAWQKPVQSQAISERGRAQAADEMVKQLLNKMRQRGCKEEFVANPELLKEGQVDFLPAAAVSEEVVAAQRAVAEAAAKATRRCQTTIDGEAVEFTIFVSSKFQTKGGYMFDLRVTCQDRETVHRVIVGKDYYEPQGLEPERTIESVFAFLLRKKVPRQTEGMILSSQFPVNYFAVSEVEQFFAEFTEDFEAELGPLPGEQGFWRFNRTQDYGYKGGNEDVERLAEQFRIPQATGSE